MKQKQKLIRLLCNGCFVCSADTVKLHKRYWQYGKKPMHLKSEYKQQQHAALLERIKTYKMNATYRDYDWES